MGLGFMQVTCLLTNGLPLGDHAVGKPATMKRSLFPLSYLHRLPATGDTLDAPSWRFKVVDLDNRRIDKSSSALAGNPTLLGLLAQNCH